MLDKRLFAYSVLVGVIPAMSHFFWSYPRMMMMAFPIFTALAVMLDKLELRWVRWYIAVIMGALNLYFILLHFNYRWTS
jgi:phosphoglycerol transferase MdoB-like AlkP superfamily enzyme